MLGVDAQPVETGASANLGRGGIGKVEPEADLAFARGQAFLETVARQVHAPSIGNYRELVI